MEGLTNRRDQGITGVLQAEFVMQFIEDLCGAIRSLIALALFMIAFVIVAVVGVVIAVAYFIATVVCAAVAAIALAIGALCFIPAIVIAPGGVSSFRNALAEDLK
jgi:CBS-domain-containing membrane protein